MRADSRKFACDWPDCRKSFFHAENLSSHRRQHTEPKPFQCDQCSLAYWQKSSLRSHRLKVHGGQTKTDKVVKMSDEQTATGSSAEQLVDGIIKSVTASIQAANSNCHTTAAAADDDDMVESLTVTISQPAEDTAADIADDVDRPEQLPSEPLSSEPLNIYEFCDDETVSISRHKPSRGPPRSNIELPQSTIELDEDDDNHDLMAFDDDMSPTVDRLAETVVCLLYTSPSPRD